MTRLCDFCRDVTATRVCLAGFEVACDDCWTTGDVCPDCVTLVHACDCAGGCPRCLHGMTPERPVETVEVA